MIGYCAWLFVYKRYCSDSGLPFFFNEEIKIILNQCDLKNRPGTSDLECKVCWELNRLVRPRCCSNLIYIIKNLGRILHTMGFIDVFNWESNCSRIIYLALVWKTSSKCRILEAGRLGRNNIINQEP